MVFFSSRNPTPELPLLEEAASELAGLDDLELLPAAAFDVDCHWHRAHETPATTLPASPHDEDACSSISDEHHPAEDYKQSHSLVPLWPDAPLLHEHLCIKNTFVELDEQMDEAPITRSRAVSDFTGLRDYEALGVTEAIVDSFRRSELAEEQFHAAAISRLELSEPQVQFVPMWVPIEYVDDAWNSGMPLASATMEWGTLYSPECNSMQAPSHCWPLKAPPSTLILSHLPIELTLEDLLEVLDREEFSGLYDFVFLPGVDAASRSRYAIVNLTKHEHGLELAARLHGKSDWGIAVGECTCEVTWYPRVQGLSELIRVYRDAPENQPEVPEGCRPQIFSEGWPVSFPPHESQ
jgi:hypothetical protein